MPSSMASKNAFLAIEIWFLIIVLPHLSMSECFMGSEGFEFSELPSAGCFPKQRSLIVYFNVYLEVNAETWSFSKL